MTVDAPCNGEHHEQFEMDMDNTADEEIEQRPMTFAAETNRDNAGCDSDGFPLNRMSFPSRSQRNTSSADDVSVASGRSGVDHMAESTPVQTHDLLRAARLDAAHAAAQTNGARSHKKKIPFCWLCRFQGNASTNEVIRFIMDAIPHMSLDSLVEQSKYLLDTVDEYSKCTHATIRSHITEHMLHPRVKLALQLQDMTKMQSDVCKCCVVNDVETGERTVNPQAMRVYLTLCAQVSTVYKMGEDKLTFNHGGTDK